MSEGCWNLTRTNAALRVGQCAARLDVDRPDKGLGEVRVADELLRGIKLLEIQAAMFSPPEAARPRDCYVRGGDLVAVYEQVAADQLRLQAYWRGLPGSESPGAAGVVELVVSVQTALLKSDPSLCVATRATAGELLHLADPAAGRFAPLDISAAPPGARDGAVCVLLRLANSAWSLAQMVHPSDAYGAELAQPATGILEIRHMLFRENLEKGVIRRGRVRAALVPRSDDTRAASACYERLAASEPMLTA